MHKQGGAKRDAMGLDGLPLYILVDSAVTLPLSFWHAENILPPSAKIKKGERKEISGNSKTKAKMKGRD